MIIGLTGTYCAGKNRVAAILEARGLETLDVDRLGHACLENQKEAIFARFGAGARVKDGERAGRVDRRALGAMVFGKPDEMAALEAIVHPEANRMTAEWTRAREGKPCVVNAALLHKSAAFSGLRAVIVVRAPFLTRLARARRRDRLPWPDLIRRLASQRRFDSQYLGANADIFRVENPGLGALPRSGVRGKRLERRLEKRIDEILADIGLAR
ncbi:MAG: dephospho-CoA kinase [Treponema sp.]|nr:dephospho-CoA kinase [Treponema sp.]